MICAYCGEKFQYFQAVHVSGKVFCSFYCSSRYDKREKAKKKKAQKEARAQREQSKLGRWFDLTQYGSTRPKRTQNVKLFRWVKKEYYRKQREEIFKLREKVKFT